MDVFALKAVLSLDKEGYERGLKESEERAGIFASVLKANLVTKGIEVCVKGLTTLGNKAADVFKGAIDSYANYEQLVGGVQTLFGSSAKKVLDDAEKAYKTAGMSANQYMETSIQSAASLINSLGGDQEKAAELMNMSIVDMSDNVNKMGTSMGAVQNAYRGFSRGNFTMLDNLALGFSGTKEGMQELLDKAEQLSGVKYDISSYSDIVQAIHEVQSAMGIAGTTKDEAEGTISGSLGSLQAAWANMLTSIAGGDKKKIQTGVKEIVSIAIGVLKNMLPIVRNVIFTGFPTLFKEIATRIPQLGKLIINKLPEVWKQINRAIQKDFIPGIAKIVSKLAGGNSKLTKLLTSNFRKDFRTIVRIFREAGKKLSEFWRVVVKPIAQGIIRLIAGHVMPLLHNLYLYHIAPLWKNIAPRLSQIFNWIANYWSNTLYPALVKGVRYLLNDLAPRIINTVHDIWVRYISPMLDGVIAWWNDSGRDMATSIRDWIVTILIPKLGELWTHVVQKLIDGVKNWWNRSGRDMFNGIKDFITKTLLPKLKEFYDNILSPLVEKLGGIEGIVDGLMAAIGVYITAKTITTALGTIHGLIIAIITGFHGLTAAITGFAPVVAKLALAVAVYKEYQQLAGANKEYKELYAGSRDAITKNLDEYKRLYKEKGKDIADAYASAWVDVKGFDYNDSLKLLEYALEQQYVDIPKDMWEGFVKGWNYYFGGNGQEGAGIGQFMKDAFVNAVAQVRLVLGLDTDESEAYKIGEDIFEDFTSGLSKVIGWFDEFGDEIVRQIKSLANVFIRAINEWWIDWLEEVINEKIGVINRTLGTNIPTLALGRLNEIEEEHYKGVGRGGKVNYYANGGVLREGGLGIVGEYEPEWLQVINGRAVVTPMTGSNRRPIAQTPAPRTPINERPINIVFELDGAQRWIYRLNKAEEQRVGLKLSTGGSSY